MENDFLKITFQLMNDMGIMKFFIPMLVVTAVLRLVRALMFGGDTIDLPNKTYEENIKEQEEINHVIIQPPPKKRRKIYYHTCPACGAGAKYFLCEYCGTPGYNLQDGYEQ